MKKKYTLTLDDEFIQYCELNKISDIEKSAKETFNRGFSLLKYGETPTGIIKEKIVEREVIVEVKSEPETIIKEVIVNNTEEIQKLQNENEKLKTELDKITKSLDSLNKGRFMKNSDMSSLYDE